VQHAAPAHPQVQATPSSKGKQHGSKVEQEPPSSNSSVPPQHQECAQVLPLGLQQPGHGWSQAAMSLLHRAWLVNASRAVVAPGEASPLRSGHGPPALVQADHNRSNSGEEAQ
jgi:hypothetical protein